MVKKTTTAAGGVPPEDPKKPKKPLLGIDDVVSTIAALGVPGLVLLIVMSVMGFAGAAAITAALAALGGPLGMLGGIGVLGVLVVMSKGLAQFGFAEIYRRVVMRFYEQGMTKEDILRKIDTYPISRALKRKLKEIIEEQPG